ncbi:MAG: TRAP transporter small permease subunit [Bdellovibrionales bacterium]|nr:TRAP transporter small permease subunit [Bdellovibrionales bacterium]
MRVLRGGERIVRLFGELAAALTVVLVFVTVVDVLLRYLFRAGSVAVQEAEWHLFGLVVLLGVAETLRRDEHVRVDIIYARLAPAKQGLIDLLGSLLFLIPFAVVGIWTSASFAARAYRFGERSVDPGGLPFRFLIKGAITLGFLLLLLEGLAFAWRAFERARGKDTGQ